MSVPVGNSKDRFSLEVAHIMRCLDRRDYEPPHGKTSNAFLEQVRHKLVCTIIEDGFRLESLDLKVEE